MSTDKSVKTALVTGAAHRIGNELASSLAANGWSVAIHYNRSAEAAEGLAARLKADHGVEAEPVKADLSVQSEIDCLIERTQDTLGPLTCLINNASTFEYDNVEELNRGTWDLHMETNLWAPLRLSQLFARALPEGSKGSIINLLDQRIWKLTPEFMSYTVSKTALWTLTQTLAQALAPRVRVNAIGPGPTLRNARKTEKDFQKQIDATPLGRNADVTEIAAAMRFILETPSLTGQMIALDGGQHLIWQTPDIVGVTE